MRYGERTVSGNLSRKERVMAWDLTGGYVETCSCELMCPCNLWFDHGATYDFCRVSLVFSIQRGQIEGTDIAGCKVAVIAGTPKVMTDGKWRLGMYVDDRADGCSMGARQGSPPIRPHRCTGPLGPAWIRALDRAADARAEADREEWVDAAGIDERGPAVHRDRYRGRRMATDQE